MPALVEPPRWMLDAGMPPNVIAMACDPRRCLLTMRIKDKTNAVRPIRQLNATQEAVLDALVKHENVLVLKARQVYVSTVTVAFFSWLAWVRDDGYSTICLTDCEDTTYTMYDMYHRFLSEKPAMWRKHCAFTKASRGTGQMQTLNGSNLTQRMAGGRGQGRGTTNQGLHCTEAGTWPRGSAAHAGRSSGDSDEVAFTAARASRAEVDVEPLARTVIESTAEGPGNWYHRMVLVARRSKEWGFVFVPWFRHEQYRRTPIPGWEPSEAAVRLGDRFGLDIEQLAWRDYKLTDGGYSLRRFKYNYPSTPDDPFVAAGGMWFDAQLLADLYTSLLDRVERAKEDLLILESYDPTRRYVGGLDTSGGVGSDYAVLVILRDDRKVVLRWASNTTSPRGQADMAAQLCDVYGRCGLAVEVNKYGQYVLDVLDDDLMYPNLLKDPATGNWYRTTDTSKRAMYSDLRDVVDAGVADIGDPIMVMELQTIREFDDGRIEAAGKAHDDHADALAIANWAGRQEFAQASAERLRSERLERFKQR